MKLSESEVFAISAIKRKSTYFSLTHYFKSFAKTSWTVINKPREMSVSDLSDADINEDSGQLYSEMYQGQEVDFSL